MPSDNAVFWKTRSQYYDRLYWVRERGYLQALVRQAGLRRNHLVLDVGTGSGVVARAVRGRVRHVMAVDLSGDMLLRGTWEGISVFQWNMDTALFRPGIFDRVLARMILHHAVNNLEKVVAHCCDVLKPGGRLVVAEATPPSDSPVVVDWFMRMFQMKEQRVVFTDTSLWALLKVARLSNIRAQVHWIQDFSVANWLRNSGLPRDRQEAILRFHRDAPEEVQQAHHMRVIPGDCLLRSRNVIMTGEKLG